MCDCKWRVHPHTPCRGPGCHCHDKVALEQELASLLNKHSMENESGTPDFILAEYMLGSLTLFHNIVAKRAEWRGESTTFNPHP